MTTTETSTPEPEQTGREATGAGTGGARRAVRWWPQVLAVAALTVADSAVYAWIRNRGVSETGDEPHYLVVARAISHLSVHPLAAYLADLRTHQLFAWPPATPPSNLALQLYTGPHGPVSTHPVGLSVLLSPFVAAGGAQLGRAGMIVLNAAGFVYLFERSTRLARLDRRGRAVTATVLAGPALWVAATQVYPDLLTGVMLAAAAADLLTLERTGRMDRLAVIASAGFLAVLPWLHQQNLVAAGFVLAGLAVAGRRARQLRPVAFVAVTSVVSWLALVGFNLREYGHALGLPQPFPSLNGAGVTEILGLLFDRQQGLFVQMPLAALGLVGMWLWRRWTPVATVATLAAAASLLYLNGTFVHAPYGGVSFAGRFQWSSLVPLLPWCPAAVEELARRSGRLVALGLGAGALWILQAIPLATGGHSYYNQLAAGAPWDPSAYPGWWGPVDRLLPVMVPGGPLLGRPGFALAAEVAVLGAATAVAVCATRAGRRSLLVSAPPALIVFAAAALLAGSAPLPLPAGPLSYPGSDLGSPFVAGASVIRAGVALQDVAAGTYTLTVRYRLEGSGTAAELDPHCFATALPQTRVRPAILAGGSHVATVQLHCRPGPLFFAADIEPASTLTITSAQLRKTASG